MIDLKLLREEPDRVRAMLERRGAADRLDELLRLDRRRRELLPDIEEDRARRNRVSDEIAEAKRAGRDAEASIAEMRELSSALKAKESELSEVESARDELAAELPNLPDEEAPDGQSEDDAVVLRTVGELPSFGFEPRDHLEIGTALGVIDMDSAARASGTRFAYLKGDLARAELALVQWALTELSADGYEAVVPPVLVREEAMFGTGFLPGDRDQIYEIPRDELYLAGTSEVPLASLHADEIIEASALPMRYAAFSTCFRREAGAAGKDTRGIFRVHQFDKVEMFSFVEPAGSREEHERLLAIEERLLTALELPYRVVDIAAGDLGASAARKFDCEAWIPSQSRYRELTSCSNTTDFQARRLKSRYRPEDGPVEHVHTLNGTAVAVGRTLLALIENRQAADGSFTLPECLRPFGAPERIGPPESG